MPNILIAALIFVFPSFPPARNIVMIRVTVFVFLMLFASVRAFSQMAENDDCFHATVLHPGEVLSNENNLTATPSPPGMQPETLPVTCIQSIENELWYQFRTTGSESWYAVEIIHGHCNTPAGLQALLIETGSCDKASYIYRSCASFQSTDTIRLYLKESRPGIRILVWVDGYDGTLCNFSIGLRAMKDAPDPLEVFRFNRFSFHPETQPSFEPVQLAHRFLNNQLEIEWQSPPDENVKFFVVERLHFYPSENTFAAALAVIEPQRFTAKGDIALQYRDDRGPFQNGEKVYYRILKVTNENEVFYSDAFGEEVLWVDGFYLNEYTGGIPEGGLYRFHYLNFRKGASYRFELRDAMGKTLKSLEMKKEPVRDGDITLDMRPYLAGYYRFIMSNGKQHFERKFFWSGK